MIEMQNMLDRVYLSNKLIPNMKIMYVNGDCTKWSAAETMTSFISMCMAFKTKISEKMYNLLLSTYNCWSNKEIQVPLDIINKVVVPDQKQYNFISEKLKYLNNNYTLKNGLYKSTQNFLQGMFNYSSSYKAVCCTNYTYYIWKKIYPNSKLYIEHMEHSDDYVTIILYEDESDFQKFRILHKIMMRFHGYSDSDRKTNCQPFFMEFVSLMSFNGMMLYPQIKKIKRNKFKSTMCWLSN